MVVLGQDYVLVTQMMKIIMTKMKMCQEEKNYDKNEDVVVNQCHKVRNSCTG